MIPRTMRACAVSAGLLALLLPTAAEARLGDSTLEVGDRGRDVKTAQRLIKDQNRWMERQSTCQSGF